MSGSPFLVQKHKNCDIGSVLLLYIPKYILTFAAVLLTLNTTLMKYKVSYTTISGMVFSGICINPDVYRLMHSLEKREIKSLTVSLHETEQKGGQYEQQSE